MLKRLAYHKTSLLLCLYFILAVQSLPAQVTAGMIFGVVKDETGAVLPGALVSFKNLETGITRTVITDDEGRYSAPNLPLGNYEVQAVLSGFQTGARTGIRLTVGREAAVDFVLKVGEISEKVTVTGEAPLVDTTSSEVSGLVEEKTIRELPLNGRDLMQLMTLQPGVAFNRVVNKGVHSGGVGQRAVIHGTRETQNLFLLDGTQLNDTLSRSPGGEAGVFMGVEAVKEFKVILHNFSAEYGRAAGGVFNAVTKSGTNSFDGSIYYFHRNSAFDARNFFDLEEVAPFKRNHFGFSLGGPVVKNKTFFFGNYEGLRDRLNKTVLLIVPSQSARQGVVGPTRVEVNPAVRPYLELYPLPNGRDLGDGRGELFSSVSIPTDEDYFTVRVDHKLGDSDSFFTRYTFDDSGRTEPTPRRIVDFPQRTQSKRSYLTIEETKILSPHLINVFRFGFSRSNTNSVPAPRAPHVELAFVPGQPVGEIVVSGLADTGTRRQDPRIFILNTFQWSDALSWAKGAHSLKFGVDFTRFQFNQTDTGIIRGAYQFPGLVAFLQGLPNRFSVSGVDPQEAPNRGFRQSLMGVFVQDDLRLRPNFTLNLGLRYEFATIPHEVFGRLSRINAISDSRVTIDGRFFSSNPTLRDFAPRVGFAWDPFKTGRTSVRGGFGIFYDPPLSSHWRNPTINPPFRAENSLLPPATPAPVFPNAFQLQRDLLVGARARSILFVMEPEPSPAYVMQYSLTIQREIFSGTVVSVGYSGHRGARLMAENDFNIGIPTILPDGRKFFPPGTRPRNPNFGFIRLMTYDDDSWYNAFLLSVNKRPSHGIRFQASYTFSKTIDTGSLMNWGDGDDRRQRTRQDPFNKNGDRGLSDLHFAHNLVVN